MAEEQLAPQAAQTGATAGQAPAAGAAAETPAQGAGGFELEGERFDQERALATIRKLREFEKSAKAQLKELETLRTQAKTADAAKLSDQERLTQRVAELEQTLADAQTQHQERTVRYEVLLKASELGLVDLDAAVRLLDWAALEFDEDGRPTNTEKVLKDLIKAKPYLVKSQAAQTAPNINAGARSGSEQDQKARDDELRRRFRLPERVR